MDSANYRNPVMNEPKIFAGQRPGVQTALGRVPITNQNGIVNVPPVPPKPYTTAAQNSMYALPMNMYGGGATMYNSGMYGNGISPYMSPYMNPYRYGGMGGNMYTNGRDPMDPENRFIQLAVESSRPAFQSIESLVMAIGNIASMLDSTFFAVTSSFRAILGVAANFAQLRGVFAQFWSTFALIRGLSWLYKKLLYLLGMTKIDPSSVSFNEIFSAAAIGTSQNPEKKQSVSAWPILTFLGLIFATPYLIMKLIGQVSTTAIEQSRNPKTWVNPYAAEAIYTYKASGPNELSISAGQLVQLAPKEVQNTHKLLDSGWALATIDNQTSGLLPINYVRRLESKPHTNQMNPMMPTKINDANPLDSTMECDKQMNVIYDNLNNQNEKVDIDNTNIDPMEEL